jgi:hypothetical protein
MKIIKFALSFIVFLSILTTAVCAASGTCGENAVWEYDEKTKTLTISGEGIIDSYQMWTDYEDEIENVVIKEGITEISFATFYNHINLKNISLPESLLTIGYCGFGYCESLEKITIPFNVNSIDSSAFVGCYNLTKIDVDSNNKYYTSIDGILYNSDVTSLIAYPCYKKDSTYTLPGSVTSIEPYAFYANPYLCTIKLHDKLESIGHGAISLLYSLEELNIPKSTWYIGSGFSDCVNLSEVNVDSENPTYTSEDGVLFDKEKTKLICYPGGKKDKEYTVPETVEMIMDDAFSSSRLEIINLPENLKIIGNYAFYYSEYLTKIIFPESIEIINNNILTDCGKLSEVYFLCDLPYEDYPDYYDSEEDVPRLCLENIIYNDDSEVNVNVYYLPDKKGWDTLDKVYLEENGINLLIYDPSKIIESDTEKETLWSTIVTFDDIPESTYSENTENSAETEKTVDIGFCGDDVEYVYDESTHQKEQETENENRFLDNIRPYLPYAAIIFTGIAVIVFVAFMLSKKSNKTIKHTGNKQISNQTEVLYSNNTRNMTSTQKEIIVKCPECGFECEHGSLFCGNCGKRLSDK